MGCKIFSAIKSYTAAATIAVLVFGCGHSQQMAKSDVIRVANQAAETAGYHLTNYNEPQVHIEFTDKVHTWTVFYDSKVPMPGNHFLVWVDDRTKATHIIAGK
jgi:hypothetical protein